MRTYEIDVREAGREREGERENERERDRHREAKTKSKIGRESLRERERGFRGIFPVLSNLA